MQQIRLADQIGEQLAGDMAGGADPVGAVAVAVRLGRNPRDPVVESCRYRPRPPGTPAR